MPRNTLSWFVGKFSFPFAYSGSALVVSLYLSLFLALCKLRLLNWSHSAALPRLTTCLLSGISKLNHHKTRQRTAATQELPLWLLSISILCVTVHAAKERLPKNTPDTFLSSSSFFARSPVPIIWPLTGCSCKAHCQSTHLARLKFFCRSVRVEATN